MNCFFRWVELAQLLTLLFLTAFIPSVIDHRIVVGAGPQSKFLFFQFGVAFSLLLYAILFLRTRELRFSVPSIMTALLIAYLLIRAAIDPIPGFAFARALEPLSWLTFALLWAAALQQRNNWVPFLSAISIGQLFAITYAVVESFGVDIFFTYILGKPGQRWQNELVGEDRVLIWTSLGNPNYYASYAGMLLCIVVALIVLSRSHWLKGIWSIYAVAIFCTLVLTYARGIWVSLTVMLCTLATGYVLTVILPSAEGRGVLKRFRYVLLGTLVVVILLSAGLYVVETIRGGGPLHRIGDRFYSLVTLRDASMRARPLMWTGALRMWREAPLIGQGIGQYPVQYLQSLHDVSQTVEQERIHRLTRQLNTIRADYAHNDYVQVLAEWGLVGHLLFVGVLSATSLYGFWLLYSQSLSPPRRIMLLMALAIVILSAAHSCFDFPIHLPASAMLLATGIGFIVALLHQYCPMQVRVPVWLSALGALLIISASGMVLWITSHHLIASHLSTNAQSILTALQTTDSVPQRRAILDAAQETAKRSLDLNPYNGEALYTLGRTYWLLAPILSDRFDYKQTSKSFMDQALKTTGAPQLYKSLCRVNTELFALQPAREQSDILLMIQPEERDVQYLAGLVRLRGNQWEEALPHFQREVSMYPEHSEAWLQIARIYDGFADNPFAAAQAYEQCIASSPDQIFVDVHANLSRLYAEELMNNKEALHHARIALANAERADMVQWIEPMRLRIRDLERRSGQQPQ